MNERRWSSISFFFFELKEVRGITSVIWLVVFGCRPITCRPRSLRPSAVKIQPPNTKKKKILKHPNFLGILKNIPKPRKSSLSTVLRVLKRHQIMESRAVAFAQQVRKVRGKMSQVFGVRLRANMSEQIMKKIKKKNAISLRMKYATWLNDLISRH